MGGQLVLDASRTKPGVTCGSCRQKRHKFSFAADWQQGDGCPCCWTHAIAELRRHVDRDHGQGSAAYEGLDATIVHWHNLEHKPNGCCTHLDHAHDEVSARRYVVPLMTAQAHSAEGQS